MSKKKSPGAKKSQPATPAAPAKKSGSKLPLIIGIVVVVGVIVGLIVANGNKGGGTAGASADEAKYMGRFLPEGYQEPNVGSGPTGGQRYEMATTQATDEGTAISVPLSDLTAAKIVSFAYQKDAEPLPLLAYIKPSGKLFVGVDYCPPCSGVGQTIESDGTLTCNTCGTKRTLESGVGISGSCKLYPVDELPVKVEGDKIVLEKSAIDAYSPQPLDRPSGG